jgi:hypothetical protein
MSALSFVGVIFGLFVGVEVGIGTRSRAVTMAGQIIAALAHMRAPHGAAVRDSFAAQLVVFVMMQAHRVSRL